MKMPPHPPHNSEKLKVSEKRIQISDKTVTRIDKKADPEKLFRALLRQEGLLQPVSEFVFASPRRWRFDYAWPENRVALEVEGGIWTGGRHTRGAGFLKDIEKYNRAAELGWLVLRTSPANFYSDGMIQSIKAVLTMRGAA